MPPIDEWPRLKSDKIQMPKKIQTGSQGKNGQIERAPLRLVSNAICCKRVVGVVEH